MAGQDAAEALLEDASTSGLNMGATWEKDAQQCEVRTTSNKENFDSRNIHTEMG